MNMQFKLRGIARISGLRSFVEEQLEEIQEDLPITSAEVTLENQTGTTPACWVRVHLMVPGPDIRLAARDHTLLAAWLKVSNELRREIKRRKARTIARLKSNLRVRGAKGGHSGNLAGQSL